MSAEVRELEIKRNELRNDVVREEAEPTIKALTKALKPFPAFRVEQSFNQIGGKYNLVIRVGGQIEIVRDQPINTDDFDKRIADLRVQIDETSGRIAALRRTGNLTIADVLNEASAKLPPEAGDLLDRLAAMLAEAQQKD